MQNGPVPYVLLAGLAIALVTAAFTDLRSRRIGNWLTGVVALAAPLFWWASGLSLGDIGWQVGVAAATLVVLSGLFALRAIGGGDVKLLTALALWIRPHWFLDLLTIMAIAGGVLTLAFAAWHIARRERHRMAIPYGVAIALAGLWVLGTDYLPMMNPAVPHGVVRAGQMGNVRAGQMDSVRAGRSDKVRAGQLGDVRAGQLGDVRAGQLGDVRAGR